MNLNLNPAELFIDLILTVVAYCTIPVLFSFFYPKKLSRKAINWFTIVHSIVVYSLLGFLILYNNPQANAFQGGAAVIWTYVSIKIMKKITSNKPDSATVKERKTMLKIFAPLIVEIGIYISVFSLLINN